jgi:hypothetical protein
MSENTFKPAEEPVDVAEIEGRETTLSEPTLDATLPAAAVEPSAAPRAAAEKPMHVGITVDQRAYQQYQSLAQVVLDSAELATKSAEAATSVSSQLRRATDEFKEVTEAGHKKARLLMAVMGGVMAVSYTHLRAHETEL